MVYGDGLVEGVTQWQCLCRALLKTLTRTELPQAKNELLIHRLPLCDSDSSSTGYSAMSNDPDASCRKYYGSTNMCIIPFFCHCFWISQLMRMIGDWAKHLLQDHTKDYTPSSPFPIYMGYLLLDVMPNTATMARLCQPWRPVPFEYTSHTCEFLWMTRSDTPTREKYSSVISNRSTMGHSFGHLTRDLVQGRLMVDRNWWHPKEGVTSNCFKAFPKQHIWVWVCNIWYIKYN
jgi:hypothetical protein